MFGSIIAIILIISTITYYIVQRNTIDEQGKTLATIASALGKRLDRILFERQADISVLAHTPLLLTNDRDSITQHLQLIQNTYKAYSWIGLTDEKGQVIAATIPSTVGIIMNQDPAFNAIQRTTDIYIEDAEPRDILEDQFALMIAIAIQPNTKTSQKATFKKGLFAYIPLDQLALEFIRQTAVLQQQYAVMSMIEWQLLRHDGLVLFDSSNNENGTANLLTLNYPSTQAVSRGEDGYVEERHHRRDIDVLTGYSQMKGSGLASTFHWGILVRRDLEEVLSESRKLLWTFAAAVICLLCFIGLLAWTTHRLQRSQVLERAANRSTRRAEKRLRGIIEAAPSGMIMIDRAGTIVLANALISEQFHYTNDDLINHSIDTLVPERFRPQHTIHRTKFFSATETRYMGAGRELFGRRQDGSEFPIEIGLNPLLTDDGHYVVASVIDITERKHAEKQLQELNRTKELILKSAGEGIYGLDVTGHVIFINVAGATMLGYSPKDLIGLPMHSTIHHTKPDGSPYPHDVCPKHTAIQDGRIQQVRDEVFWRKDGTCFPVEYTIAPIKNEHGEIEGAVVTFQDVTEQKKQQDEINILTERLQIATQAAQIGVWDWDVQHNRLTWDDRMHALYGSSLSSRPLTYETWLAAVHPRDSARTHEELQDALHHHTHFNTNFRIIWPDYTVHHIQTYAVVNRNKSGEAIRMTGVNWDITNEKINEEVLTQYIENLRRSNSELEQFAYVASHDLQEPLRKIRNFSELLSAKAEGHLSPELEKFLTPIVSSATRMQALVQDLLTYSRIAREGPDVAPVDLQVLVEQVKNSLESAIAETQATLIIAPLPTIEANATQIEQLFQNLIANSLKYHGDRAPRITITATQHDTYWQFAVSDNGIGIDPQYADRIFVIFQRLHTKQKYDGTGIGLAICKKIVERHEGQIWVESTPDEGSTFFFTLPSSQTEKDHREVLVSEHIS
ncbi:MAG: hypothetical protein NPIRA02_27860 [Nitrospirales bacterium]|nr:MAG: hypothetical protein NPIRA02_27860 [Nitrospirales bacterium]